MRTACAGPLQVCRKSSDCRYHRRMPIRDLLVLELDEEAKKTRAALARVPNTSVDFKPHSKSMPLNRLAPHVAELAGFGLAVLTGPGLDFSQGTYKPLPFES